MKKSHFILAGMLVIASCTGKNQSLQQQQTAEKTVTAETKISTDELNLKITELVKHIPDHRFNTEDMKYFTPEFGSMLSKAFALPPLEEDGIDEASEFLYYFIEGNGDCQAFCAAQGDEVKALSLHKCENFKTEISGDKAVSSFDYVHGPNEVDHVSIVLKKSGSDWLIDDWNDQKKAVKDYLEYYKQRKEK